MTRSEVLVGVAVGAGVPLLTFLLALQVPQVGWWLGSWVFAAVAFFGVLLTAFNGTRRFALGMLLGFTVLVVLGAGVCTTALFIVEA